MRIKTWRGRIGHWQYLIYAATLAVIAVFWLEWVGSERPLVRSEVPVKQAVKQKTGSNVEK